MIGVLMLNKQQQEAIDVNNNVVLVVAGPGTGKTTVLIEKIISLLNKDVALKKILALTFTNNAAKNIKNRLEKIVNNEIKDCNSFTFHSFAALMLRIYNKYLVDLNQDFQIIDTIDQKKIVKKIIDENKLDFELWEIINTISNAKTISLTHNEIKDNLESKYINVYEQYQQFLVKSNYMDFDDLMLYLNEILDIDEVRESIQNRFDYILIDEYQDTSKIQDIIVQKIKKIDTQLFIVGDIDQSIYGWRGAYVENMLNIPNLYEDVKIVKLEKNYRSTDKIIDIANQLIVYNNKRFDKSLETNKMSDLAVNYKNFTNDLIAANFIIKELTYNINKHPDKQFAILYRNNAQSKVIEDALINNSINYQILGGMRFFERMEIKDILAYLKLILNHEDNISFLRIVNVPKRKIGDKTINKIIELSNNYDISYFAALELAKINKNFISIINKYKDLLEEDFLVNFDNLLKELDYYTYLKNISNSDEKYAERVDNINILKESINENLAYMSLEEYLLTINLDNIEDQHHSNVILSTIHGVKGLEFDCVYLFGLNQGILPSYRAINNDEDAIEEERRICYVAITRAKEELTLISYDHNFNNNYQPSQFIYEMNLDDDPFFSI